MKTELIMTLISRILLIIFLIYLIYKILPHIIESFRGGAPRDNEKDDLNIYDIVQRYKNKSSSLTAEQNVRKSKFILLKEKYQKEIGKMSENLGASHSDVLNMQKVVLFWGEAQLGEGDVYREVEQKVKENKNLFHKEVIKIADKILEENISIKKIDDIAQLILKNIPKKEEKKAEKKKQEEKIKSPKEEFIRKNPQLLKAYKTLHLDFNATKSDAKKSFNKLAKKYHPDAKGSESGEGHDAFLTLKESYDLVLKFLKK